MQTRASDYMALAGLGDAHVPDHDESACLALRAFLRYLNPELAWNNGDWWGLRNFGKYKEKVDPLLRMRSGQELRAAKALFEYCVVDACRDGEVHASDSNHTDRLRKDIWTYNPELWTIDEIRLAAQIPELMGYRELGVHWHEGMWWPRPWLACHHGEAIRKWAGSSVRAEMVEKVGAATMMGHTHRLCAFPVTQEVGTMWGCECGHLQNNPPHYGAKGVRDWQQGCVVAWLHRRKPIVRFELCPIEDGALWWRGKEFSA